MMAKKVYLVTVAKEDEWKLKEYCTIMTKLTLLNGLYIIETEHDENFLNNLEFIKEIESDDIYGNLEGLI